MKIDEIDGGIPVWTPKLSTQVKEKLIQKNTSVILSSVSYNCVCTFLRILIKYNTKKGGITELVFACFY